MVFPSENFITILLKMLMEQIIPIPFSKASQIRSDFVSGAKDLGFTFHAIRPGECTL